MAFITMNNRDGVKMKNTIKEFLRYCLVGGLAFLVDFGILVFVTQIVGLDHKISTIFGFMAGLTVNYILSKVFVFKKQVSSDVKAFLTFTAIGTIGLGITELGMWQGVDKWGFDYRIVKIFITGVVLIWNFAGRKLLVFNNRQESEDA